MNSKQKGKRGELELVHLLKDYGIEARRGQQYEGGSDSPDVVAGAPFDNVHLEVKRREAGNVYDWLDQAIAEASSGKLPVVAHKRNGKRWIAILDFDKLVDLLKKLNS